MMRRLFIAVLSVWFVPFVYAQQNTEDHLTITTYYPSPYGVYRNLRLHPSSEPAGSAVQPGVMYFNQSENAPYVYMDNTLEWQPMSGLWQKNGDNISTVTDGSVNITGDLIASNGIVVGNNNAASPEPGTIRFTGTGFEGYYNGKWNPLFGTGDSGVPSEPETPVIRAGHGVWEETCTIVPVSADNPTGFGPCTFSRCLVSESPAICAGEDDYGCEDGWGMGTIYCNFQARADGTLDLTKKVCSWACEKRE